MVSDLYISFVLSKLFLVIGYGLYSMKIHDNLDKFVFLWILVSSAIIAATQASLFRRNKTTRTYDVSYLLMCGFGIFGYVFLHFTTMLYFTKLFYISLAATLIFLMLECYHFFICRQEDQQSIDYVNEIE